MDFNQYQAQATKTATYDPSDKMYALMYLSLGLAGESGEAIDKIKKIIRNDNGVLSDEKREELKKEFGDVLWYLAQFARVLDYKFSDFAEANLNKLSDRQARGAIKSEGDNR